MAAARAALLAPQTTMSVPVQRAALVVGGGAAGMTAALVLAEQGFPVHLVEKEAELGGNLRQIYTSQPPFGVEQPRDPQATLQRLTTQVHSHPAISLHLKSKVVATSGFMGNFTTTILHDDGERVAVTHGATILATGGQEYRGPEYAYGTHPKVISQQEFEAFLANQQSAIKNLKSIAMILCVGPAEKYCSRICCSVSLKNALRLKEINPQAEVVILYKDIRTYGFKERLYTEARKHDILFARYDDAHPPQVEVGQDDILPYDGLTVRAWDASLGNWFTLQPDILVLSMPIVPRPETADVARLFKVPTDRDGFFLEAHVKLRPVDFTSDGVFMAGMAHYPKLLDETLIQAQAAAARAGRVLSRETLTAGSRVAVVDPELCTGCLTCVRICPYGVPKIQADLTGVGGIVGAAFIEAAVCLGCGSCVAECPARAIQLMHYTDAQMKAKVAALFGSLPVKSIEG